MSRALSAALTRSGRILSDPATHSIPRAAISQPLFITNHESTTNHHPLTPSSPAGAGWMLSDHQRTDELPFINMTPMVDVVLCLLVFFMAATRLYDWDESQFIVRVPEVSEAAPLTSAPDDLTLTILAPGRVLLGETTYDLTGLTRTLRDFRARYADQGVLIRGDATLNYQDLADVLATCEAAGIRNVRLPVRPREAAED